MPALQLYYSLPVYVHQVPGASLPGRHDSTRPVRRQLSFNDTRGLSVVSIRGLYP